MDSLLEGRPAKRRFRARGAYVVGIIVLAALGALYTSYVSRRADYLIARDLRLLNTAAAQLDAQIDSHKAVIRNFAHADFWCDPPGAPIVSYGASSPAWLRKYLPDFVNASRGGNANVTIAGTASGAFRDQLIPNGDGTYNIEIQYRSSAPSQDATLQCALPGEPKAIGQLPLNNLTAPIFDKKIFAAFDAILLVGSDGSVLYQAEPRAQQESRQVWNRITPASGVDANASPSLVLSNLTNLGDRGSKPEKPIDLSRLQNHTGSTYVDIAGSTYRLLSQPCLFNAPPLAGTRAAPWVVCGLIERSRFMQDATEISASLIALAMALLILAASCWPLLKLAFSGPAEPITRADVVMVAVAVLLSAGIISLVFLDFVSYGRMKSIADYQHRAFAAHAAAEMRLGINHFMAIRNELERQTAKYADAYIPVPESGRVSLENFGDELPAGSNSEQHSAFSSFAWVNNAGKQVIRASMTAGTPPLLDVHTRAYFQAVVRQKRPWTSANRNDDRLHLRLAVFESIGDDEFRKNAISDASTLRENVVKGSVTEWGAELYSIRGRMYDELQQAIARLKPGDVAPVVHAPGRLFVVKLLDPPQPQQFFVESVRTLTNGQPEAVIAFPTDRPALPLFTITFPFIQLIERLGPPAMSYAVVDNAGNVLFHSDSERNGIENIFTETDHNRQLRAAIIAHHEEFIDAKYWGEDERILVTPLEDVPWTLLTFRNKHLLRTMNLETLVISLLLFLMCVGIPVGLVVAIMLARPSYRARWAWPLLARYSDWRDLRRLYLATLTAFIICTATFSSSARLVVAFTVPVQVLLGTYLLLNRDSKRLAYGLAAAAWFLLTLGIFGAIVAADMNGAVLPFTAGSWVVRAMLFLLAAIAVHAVLVRHAPRITAWRAFARVYTACGVLLVLQMAVIPMVAFFQTAVGNELEALVKAGQLDLANRLMHRMDAVTEKSWTDPHLMLWYHMPFFFESTWCVQMDWFSSSPETFGHLRRPCDRTSTMRGANEMRPSEPFVPATNDIAESIESLLPQYSDQTVAMRDLHHGLAGDRSWYALRSGRVLALFRRLELSRQTRDAISKNQSESVKLRAANHVAAVLRSRGVPAIEAFEQASAAAQTASEIPNGKLNAIEREALDYMTSARHQAERLAAGGQWLVVVSRMPVVLPLLFGATDPLQPFPKSAADLPLGEENTSRAAFPGPPPDAQLPSAVRRIPMLISLLAALGVLVWVIRFIARRIFLYDIREPEWLAATPLRPPFSEHLFVISAEHQIDTVIDTRECCRIRFREFSHAGRRADVVDYLSAIGSMRHILLEDFGYRLGDSKFTSWKLDVLESLVKLSDRTIIVVSSASPALVLTVMTTSEEAQRERWATVLRSFVWIDRSRSLMPSPIAVNIEAATAARPAPRFFRDIDQAVHRSFLGIYYWFRQFKAERRQRRDRSDDLRWLRRETRASLLLRQFRSQLKAVEGGREQMIDELCERTDKYYEALWQMCSFQERLVLIQVAQYGVVNASNRRVIRRLLMRGLLTREPELRLFNDTFRMFVCGREDEVRQQRAADPTGTTIWDQLRIPLFIGLLVVGAVFLGTQKELANATSAIVTALATGLPVVVKLIGTFTDRRLAAAQR